MRDILDLKTLPLYNVSKKIKKDDKMSLFVTFISIKGLEDETPANLTYTMEIIDWNSEILLDRMNDPC